MNAGLLHAVRFTLAGWLIPFPGFGLGFWYLLGLVILGLAVWNMLSTRVPNTIRRHPQRRPARQKALTPR